MTKQTKRVTCWVLMHVFVAFVFLQGVPARAQVVSTVSPLTPLDEQLDPLESIRYNLLPNLMVLVDTSGSMEENPSNKGLRLGADDPRSKMNILKRALRKLINQNSDKINIGLATYNQATSGGGIATVLKYDFDYLYADTGRTVVTTDDPTATPAPAGVTRGPDGQYFLNGTHILVGPFIPTNNFNGLAFDSSAARDYSYLWSDQITTTIPPDPVMAIPGRTTSFNLDNNWHVHDDSVNHPPVALEPDPDGVTRVLMGAIINDDFWYDAVVEAIENPTVGDEDKDADPAPGPYHRTNPVDSGGTVYSGPGCFDAGWQLRTYITPDSSVASNPGLNDILRAMNPQNYEIVASVGDGDSDIDNPGTTAGLVSRGNTPLVTSMRAAFEYFNWLNNAGYPTRWTAYSSGPGEIRDPETTFPTPPPTGCRKNFLLIVTDGKDTVLPPGSVIAGIDDVMIGDPAAYNDGIIDLGVKVLVVGFSLSGEGSSQVNQIAADSDMDPVDAMFDPSNSEPDSLLTPFLAIDEPSLLSSLESAFNAIASGKFVSSSPVLATDVHALTGHDHTGTHFYGNAPARVNQNVLLTSYSELPMFKGHLLEYRLFNYPTDSAVVIDDPPLPLWDAGSRSRSRSLVITAVPNSPGTALEAVEFFPYTSNPLEQPGTQTPTDFPFGNSEYTAITDAMEVGHTLTAGFDDLDWNALIRWVRSSYGLETGPLVGAIGSPVMASPALVGPPVQEPPPDGAYVGFASTWMSRPPVVYQAADDGMVHAIVGGLSTAAMIPSSDGYSDGYGNTSFRGGEELWAFIPYGMLKNLAKFGHNQAAWPTPDLPEFSTASADPTNLVGQTVANHRFMVDADIVTADVKIGGAWKTVIVGGYGPGGEGYWCLDVTNPFTPIPLWDTEFNWEPPHPSDPDYRTTLGLTYSTPRIGQMMVRYTDVHGVDHVTPKWAVFVASGYHDGRDASEEAVSAERGRTFYVINMEDGTLIYSSTIIGAHSNTLLVDDLAGTAIKNKLPSGVALIDEDFNDLVDDVYIGDSEGRMWKFAIDNSTGLIAPAVPYGGAPTVPYMFDDDPLMTATQMPLTGNPSGANTGKQPIIQTPAARMYSYSEPGYSDFAPIVFFGTGGDGRVSLVAGDQYMIDGFIDPDLMGKIDPKGRRFCSGAVPLYDIPENEQLVGTPVLLGSKLYFTTFRKNVTDPCSKGTGWLYELDFADCLNVEGTETPSPDVGGPGGTPGPASLGEGVPGGIAAGPGGIYAIGETGSVVGIQGGAGADGTGTGPGGINPQPRVGTAGQTWREEEH